jgi:hypothetical protein
MLKKLECSSEDCPWCDSTGDIKRNNRIYWGVVLIVIVFLVILYILAERK